VSQPPSIEFRDATFGLLRNVSLTIPSGTFAAVVGPTGAGKSTLLGLIARSNVPDKGSVIIDGNEADIVLFDEGRGPSRIQPGQTVVMATYRLEPVVNAGAIFVIENGAIVERGTHDSLLKKGGAYAKLWRKQSGFSLHEEESRAEIDIPRLEQLPLFATLGKAVLAEMQPLFRTEHFPTGRVMVYEGDPGDRFYILVRGRASVTKANVDGDNPDEVGVLRDGDFFGEIALLKHMPRSVTVHATQPCICLSLSRENFDQILDRFPEIKKEVTDVARARYEELGRDW
jgi:ATP-binding cassette subfamily B protein